MNPTIKNYFQQAELFFPVLGKPERVWLSRRADEIEDYFSEQEPSSLEAVRQAFGPPQRMVQEYLAQADTRAVVRRVENRRRTRLCAWAASAILLLGVLTAGVRVGLLWKGDQVVGDYHMPVYSEDGSLVGYEKSLNEQEAERLESETD
ncbi:MAG: DUF6120 family protein [Clostridiales bacterium]|nr:DUF6120 family protein [Clostridiales bacterium]